MNKKLRIIGEKLISEKEKLEKNLNSWRDFYSLKIPILMYHHIGTPTANSEKPQLYVDLKLFGSEMEYLYKNKFITLNPDDLTVALKNKERLPDRSIIITFDDGNLDFYTDAFPVLKKYKLKSTVYVVSDWTNKQNYLSLKELHELIRTPLVSIGSHTVNHKNLTQIPLNELKSELRDSKKTLERELKLKLTSLAYPFGSYNQSVVNETENAGYTNAVTTEYGHIQYSNMLFELKRIRLGNKLDLSDFIRRVK